MSQKLDPDMWVGLKRCGCCAAVCVDETDYPRDVEKSKREFLKYGYSVLRVTWNEWQSKYMPTMRRHCGHEAVK